MQKIICLLLLGAAGYAAQAQEKNYTVLDPSGTEQDIIARAARVVPSARQLRWQRLELTAFFHFGINTFTDREWGTGKEDPALFNPTAFDAGQWIRTVKQAGFRQVILTVKHHDGFCLWPSRYTEHSVKHSPWKNGKGDVVREVSDACRRYGIGFGVYLSPWDRNSPLYGTEAYNDYFVNQLTELLTQYGRIDEVWFDGANGEGPNGKKQVYDFDRWYKLIRRLQPDAVIAIMGPDVRWVGTESGHGRETEWSVVPADNLDQAAIAAGSQQDILFRPQGDMVGDDLGSRDRIRKAGALIWYPAETDISIRPGWFYHEAEDNKVKTPEQLLEIYFHSVGRNSVLLLNIPPDRRGQINAHDMESLLGWRKRLDEIFSTNLAKGAVVRSSGGLYPESLVDGKYETAFTADPDDTTASPELNLAGTKTFNVLSLQENITAGQRIEKFTLQYWDGHAWQDAVAGTTVGYKRLLRFDLVSTNRIRLQILSSRLNPSISELGLYDEK